MSTQSIKLKYVAALLGVLLISITSQAHAQLTLLESVDNATWRSTFNQPGNMRLYGAPGPVCASKMATDPAPTNLYGQLPSVFVVDTYDNAIIYRFWDTTSSAFGYRRFSIPAPNNFSAARGIASFSNGDVYLDDTFHNKIVQLRINANTISQVSSISGLGYEPGQFNAPFQINSDSSGNLYVADAGNNRIQKFTRSLLPLNTFPDRREFLAQSSPINFFGKIGSNPGQLLLPEGVAVNYATHDIYVADTGNNRIQQFDSGGNFIRLFNLKGTGIADLGPQAPRPTYLDIDTKGRVFVVDQANNKLHVFTKDLTYLFSSRGNPSRPFNRLVGVAIEKSQTSSAANYSHSGVYVTDFGRLQRFGVKLAIRGLSAPQSMLVNQGGGCAAGIRISYVLTDDAKVTVQILPLTSTTPVATSLNQQSQAMGNNSVDWNGFNTITNTPVAPGLYIIRVTAIGDDGSKVIATDYLRVRSGLTCPPTPTPSCISCGLTNNQNAGLVIGQPNFNTSAITPVTANTMNLPNGVFQVGTTLFGLDSGNNRVLIYSPIPTTNSPAAIKVIGQSSFSASAANQGGSTNLNTFNYPQGIWTDGTRMIIADTHNNRVLIFNNVNTLPTFNGSANVVIGQTTMTGNQFNQGSTPAANTLGFPFGVFYDGSRLFISDFGNNRILVYNSLPTTNGASADEVIGQVDFSGSSQNQSGSTSAKTLAEPFELWIQNGTLYVADGANNRILGFNNAGAGIDSLTTNDPSADMVLGQSSFTAHASGGTANTMNSPEAVCVTNCQLFVADSFNSRVLVYDTLPTGTTNPPADAVLGQPDFTTVSSFPVTAMANDFFPVALHSFGNKLYVADTAFNRVLQFNCTSVAASSKTTMKASIMAGHATDTPTPTPHAEGLIQSVVAAPNVCRNGQPTHFNITLDHAASVHLDIFTLTGEHVFTTSANGQGGLNSISWDVTNLDHQNVASGLYIYLVQADDGSTAVKRSGKIAVIR